MFRSGMVGVCKGLRLICVTFGPLFAFNLHLEMVHGVYPWASHVPSVALLVFVTCYVLLTLAQACFEDGEYDV